MIKIHDILHSFENFPDLRQVKEDFRSKYGDELTLKFLRSLQSVPLTMDDSVTSPEDFHEEFLDLIENKRLDAYIDGVTIPEGIEQNQMCFTESLKYLAKGPYSLMAVNIGWSAMESCSSSEWHMHFWITDMHGTVVELTGLRRETYIGTKLYLGEVLKITAALLEKPVKKSIKESDYEFA